MTKTRLPVIGTTAASTAFCSVEITDGEGRSLHLDGNQKVSGWDPKPNALSLVQIETCPGSTLACQTACYVHSLEKHQPAIHALYRHNTDELRGILADPALASRWALLLAEWIAITQPEPGFRWHVSGDVESLAHAEWIRDVVLECGAACDRLGLPRVRHWIYTRSFDFLAPLVEVATVRGGDLALNLSADRDNYGAAIAAARWFGADEPVGVVLRICYLSVGGEVPLGLDEAAVIFPDYSLRPRQFKTFAESDWWATLEPHQRGMVCPVDSVGKSERVRCGPCSRCLS